MELVSIDYLSLEPASVVESILVMTDHFMRYAQATSTRNQTAANCQGIHDAFLQQGFSETSF